MASIRDFAAATKVSSCQIDSPLTLFIALSYRDVLPKKLGKKVNLSFIYRIYYKFFLDRELTLSFAFFCYHLLFTFASSPLLFVSFSIFRFVDCCLFCACLFCHCRCHSLPSLFSFFSLFCSMFVLIV